MTAMTRSVCPASESRTHLWPGGPRHSSRGQDPAGALPLHVLSRFVFSKSSRNKEKQRPGRGVPWEGTGSALSFPPES